MRTPIVSFPVQPLLTRGACRPCGMFLSSLAVCIGGEGPLDAELILLGEGLGADEEATGRPFVGRAGQLLDMALRSVEILREEVFVTNSVRCRPKNKEGRNRPPTAQELGHCRGWLDAEWSRLTNPRRVIVALGASAAWAALYPDQPTGGVQENQGRVVWSPRYQCWVVLSLHPAFILRKPTEMMWLARDLARAQKVARLGHVPALREPKYQEVETERQAEEMRDEILSSDYFVWDWETDGLHPVYAQGYMASFCSSKRPDFAWVLPRYRAGFMPMWARRTLTWIDQSILRPIFESRIPKGGHHVSFDCNITKSTIDVWPENVEDCTMVAHHLTNNHLPERTHGLKRLSELYDLYGRYDDPLDEWLITNGYVKRGKADGAFIHRAPDPMVRKYAATDALTTMALVPITHQQIRDAGLWDVYVHERMPFALSYGRRDRIGVRTDPARVDKLGADLGLGMELMRARLAQVTDIPDFNPNSHPQVARYLFGLSKDDVREQIKKLRANPKYQKGDPALIADVLAHETSLATMDDDGRIGARFPVIAKTETGQASTKEEILKQLEDQEPMVPLTLHYRAFSKTKGSFVDGNEDDVGGLKAAIDPDGRARPSTILTGPETFRLATRKPFPIHTIPRPLVLWTCGAGIHGHYLFDKCACGEPVCHKVTLSVRSLIIPDDHHKFIEKDYISQEYAIAAIVSGQRDWEEALLDRREDPHEYVMKLLSGRSKMEYGVLGPDGKFVFYSKQHEDEYKNLRSDWKRVNFMILYRGGAKKLARSLSDPGDPKTGRPPRVVTESDAAQMIADYYERLDAVKWWQYSVIKSLHKTGMSVSPFGTRRKLPGVYSADRFEQYEAERAAVNFPVQNSGYHVMARGLLRLEARWAGHLPLRAPFPAQVMFTIHDELVAQAREDLIEQAVVDMTECMEAPHPELVGGSGIPRGILTDTKITDAWGGLDKEVSAPVLAETSGL